MKVLECTKLNEMTGVINPKVVFCGKPACECGSWKGGSKGFKLRSE